MDGNTFGWAVALSAGLHAIAVMSLDLSPGAWRHGLQPAFQLTLQSAPPDTAAAEVSRLEVARAPTVPANRPARRPAEKGSGPPADAPQAGSSIPTPVRYYRNSEVDVPARAIEHGPVVIPEHAYLSKLGGTVKARVYIDETGSVASIEIVEVLPLAGLFEQAAVEALAQVRYVPALLAGRPVRSQKLIEVSFDPHEDRAAR